MKRTKWIPILCACVMLLSVMTCVLLPTTSAGNLLYLSDTPRDPFLTEDQLAEKASELSTTGRSAVSTAQLYAENNEKIARYNAAKAEIEQLDVLIDELVAQDTALVESMDSRIEAVMGDPRYQAAQETGNSELILTTALELAGIPREEYDAYQAQSIANAEEMQELCSRREDLQIVVLSLKPDIL